MAQAVKKAKDDWYQQQTQLVEQGMADGGSIRVVWQSLRAIQHGRAGLWPVGPRTIRRLDGQLCSGPAETQEQWHEHFTSVLNISSAFTEAVVAGMLGTALKDEMCDPPSKGEIC